MIMNKTITISLKQSVRKGQYLIIEDVMLFGVGIMLLAGVAGIFAMINSSVQEISLEYQQKEVANVIATRALTYRMTGATGSISIKIPEKIAGEEYDVIAFAESGTSMIVVGSNTETPAKVYSPLPSSGRYSGSKKIILDYDGEKLRLR